MHSHYIDGQFLSSWCNNHSFSELFDQDDHQLSRSDCKLISRRNEIVTSDIYKT